MEKWKQIIEDAAGQNSYVKCNPPATEKEIKDVEKALHIELPGDLRSLLAEMNGDNWFVFSTSQIIETNLMLRKNISGIMPLNCLLFIAGNGCGDYFGYPIASDGLKDWEIFMWEHESDNRIYKANGLKDAILKYYNNEI